MSLDNKQSESETLSTRFLVCVQLPGWVSNNDIVLLSFDNQQDAVSMAQRMIRGDIGKIWYDEPVTSPLQGEIVFTRGMSDGADRLHKIFYVIKQ
jgi:hypothetical protein